MYACTRLTWWDLLKAYLVDCEDDCGRQQHDTASKTEVDGWMGVRGHHEDVYGHSVTCMLEVCAGGIADGVELQACM